MECDAELGDHTLEETQNGSGSLSIQIINALIMEIGIFIRILIENLCVADFLVYFYR